MSTKRAQESSSFLLKDYMCVVYIAINNIDKKVYVGQTCRTFMWRLGKHKTSKDILWQAITKYGIKNFTFIENEVPEFLMDNLEINLIKLYDCIAPNGYNLDSGGCKNKHMSLETIKKMSECKMGSKNPMYGKHFTPEHSKHHSESHKGEKNAMYGQKQKDSTKELMRQKKIGKTPWNKDLKGAQSQSLETKKKISEKIAGENHPMYGKRGPLSPNFGKHRPRWPGE